MAYIGKTYGPVGYRASMQRALQQPDAAEKVRSVELAASMAEVFVGWPEKRLRELEADPPAGSYRRGGY